jgi:hypothetical protein
MARLTNRKSQAVRFFTNGARAQNAYGLFDQVGQIVRRTDKAAKLARASTARRVQPFAREEVLKVFNVRPGQLNGKFRTVTTGDTVRLFASERRLPLIAFGGKWAGPQSEGATAEIVRGKREVYASSFIAAIKGLTSIRVRKRTGSRRAPRGPVQILRGPSPRDMVTGLRSDAETRTPMGFYGPAPAQRILARLAEYHIAELRRLYLSEASRG